MIKVWAVSHFKQFDITAQNLVYHLIKYQAFQRIFNTLALQNLSLSMSAFPKVVSNEFQNFHNQKFKLNFIERQIRLSLFLK